MILTAVVRGRFVDQEWKDRERLRKDLEIQSKCFDRDTAIVILNITTPSSMDSPRGSRAVQPGPWRS